MPDAIWKRAKFLAQHSEKEDIYSITLLVMYDLELPLNYDGFDYLRHAVPIALKSPSTIVANEVYREVSRMYQPEVSIRTIERAVRDIIHKAWGNRNVIRWSRYLPPYMVRREKPPANVEFLCAMVYFLEMWQGCCKEVSYER